MKNNKKISFKELIENEVPTLVDFSASWCGPCQMMEPILKEVAHRVGNKAKIVKIDIDKNRALSQELRVMGVPTFILYKAGEIQWRQSGMASAQQLEEVISVANGSN